MRQLLEFLKLDDDDVMTDYYPDDNDSEPYWPDILENIYFIIMSMMLSVLTAVCIVYLLM